MRKEVYDVEREPRPEKVAVVDEVREKLDSADAVIVTEYRGLSVSDLAALRRSMRDAGDLGLPFGGQIGGAVPQQSWISTLLAR